jgi:hypothetical protein
MGFVTHPLFRFEDFASAHREGEARKPAASQAVLRQHVRAGHLLHVRRGLYAVVPRGTLAENLQVGVRLPPAVPAARRSGV